MTLSTVDGTMDRKKCNRVQRNIESLRARLGNVRPQELVRIAKQLGRRRSKRGKEPTYVSDIFRDARPISIPHHRTLKWGTAANILDDLEGDIFRWNELLDAKDISTPDANE